MVNAGTLRLIMHFKGIDRLLLSVSLVFIGCRQVEDGTAEDASSGPVAVFVDVTERVKLDFMHNPGVDGSYFMPESIGSGGAFLDYDNDGDLDIYLVNGAGHSGKSSEQPHSTNRLFRQDSDGTFLDVTEASGLGDTGYGMGVAVGDLDNDGDVDVYVSNYGPDALYRNNGNGTFTNITERAAINNAHWGCSLTFVDYDLDDFLDIYVTNYVAVDLSIVCLGRSGRQDYCSPAGFPGVSDVLYHNNGDGTFSDVALKSGIAKGASKGLGVVSADFNGDLYPDIYVVNDGEPNHLWINQRDGTFRDEALLLGVALNDLGRAEAGMGIALGDVDNDNDFDLFVTHLRTESNTFYRFVGDHGFQDDSVPAGLAGPSLPYTGFGAGFFDYDHDGDLDLAVANGRVSRGILLAHNDARGHWDDYSEPNLLFENDGLGRFSNVSDEAPTFCSKVENSRGLAFGDVDNDGDIDLLVMNEGGPARLLLNDLKQKGNWLMVKAVDPLLRRDVIGAKVTVTTAGRQITRLISSGYSFLSSNDARAHFGLNAATAVDQILVQWPNGQKETFPGVSANQIITLNKGAAEDSE